MPSRVRSVHKLPVLPGLSGSRQTVAWGPRRSPVLWFVPTAGPVPPVGAGVSCDMGSVAWPSVQRKDARPSTKQGPRGQGEPLVPTIRDHWVLQNPACRIHADSWLRWTEILFILVRADRGTQEKETDSSCVMTSPVGGLEWASGSATTGQRMAHGTPCPISCLRGALGAPPTPLGAHSLSPRGRVRGCHLGLRFLPPGCHRLFKLFLESPPLARFGSGSSLARTAKAKCEDPPNSGGRAATGEGMWGGRAKWEGTQPLGSWFVLTQGQAQHSPMATLADRLLLERESRV